MPKNRRNRPTIPNQQNMPGREMLYRKTESIEELASQAGVELTELPTEAEIAGAGERDRITLRDKLDALGETIRALVEQRRSYEQRAAALKDRELEVQSQAERIETRTAELKDCERVLNERERDLELREADARAGFLSQQRESLRTLKAEIQRLETERDAVIARCERDEREARERIAQARDDLRKEQETARRDLEAEKLEILNEAHAVAREREAVELKRANRKEWEAQVRRDIEDAQRQEIDELRHRSDRAQAGAERDRAVIQQLRDALSGFEELQRRLDQDGFGAPEQLLERLKTLESENRQLRQAEYTRPLDDLEERSEALQDRCDELERHNRDLERELGQIRTELATSRLGVLEKQNLAQEKRVLEQHKRTLDSAVDDLEKRLDDLTARQQGAEVFPALAKMDREPGFRPATEAVPDLARFARELRQRIATAEKTPLYYSEQTIRLLLGGLAMSQLHILQGISGTGKTSLAKAFAKAVGGECTVVPVQAGWRDRDDLLGHFNAFEKKFYERECLQALYRAGTDNSGDRINIVLLDEMNLSRPEQYFAEFLSALEMQPQEREVVLMETAVARPPRLLVEDRKLRVPDNLWFIGTANHDETTFEFADKTFDRAHVMELPRHEDAFEPRSMPPSAPISVASLHEQFGKAQRDYRQKVDAALAAIQRSGFSKSLERDFGLGWGNRLERQARAFVPVVMAAGGTLGMAFDHLLATRLFRAGKVTGRYDIPVDTLKRLETDLIGMWTDVDTGSGPEACRERLEREIERKERE